MKDWTDEDVIEQLVTRSNQVLVLSESNAIKDLKQEILDRLATKDRQIAELRAFIDNEADALDNAGFSVDADRFREAIEPKIADG